VKPEEEIRTWALFPAYSDQQNYLQQNRITNATQRLKGKGGMPVTQKDVNWLHYILNINHFADEAEICLQKGNVTNSMIFLDRVIKKLADVPLTSSKDFVQYIHVKLCLPLKVTEDMPIWQIWTKLSYFLQFASPVQFAHVEGGHRTLAMVMYFTGNRFNATSPYWIDQQSFWGDLTVRKPHSVLQTITTVYVSQPVNMTARYEDTMLKQMREWSDKLYKLGGVHNETTFVGFLRQSIVAIHGLNRQLRFTVNDVFTNTHAYEDKIDEKFIAMQTIIHKMAIKHDKFVTFWNKMPKVEQEWVAKLKPITLEKSPQFLVCIQLHHDHCTHATISHLFCRTTSL